MQLPFLVCVPQKKMAACQIITDCKKNNNWKEPDLPCQNSAGVLCSTTRKAERCQRQVRKCCWALLHQIRAWPHSLRESPDRKVIPQTGCYVCSLCSKGPLPAFGWWLEMPSSSTQVAAVCVTAKESQGTIPLLILDTGLPLQLRVIHLSWLTRGKTAWLWLNAMLLSATQPHCTSGSLHSFFSPAKRGKRLCFPCLSSPRGTFSFPHQMAWPPWATTSTYLVKFPKRSNALSQWGN